MVLETWNNIDLDDKNKNFRFKKKLQILKKEIRSWVNDCKKNQSDRLVDLRSKLCHIDKVIDQGGVNDDILLTRKIPRTCSSVADWLRISSGSYAAGGIYHGRPLVHMLIGLIGSIPSD
ncbi:hypothetical protein Tco_0562732 [Tanacetum coccineum]